MRREARRRRGDGEGAEDGGEWFEEDERELYAMEGGDMAEQTDNPFWPFEDMRDAYVHVVAHQSVFPVRIPKPGGLAKILNPELASAGPQYDHQYPFQGVKPGGLQPFDFAPDDTDLRPGIYRYSEVDRLLATHEEEAELCLRPLPPLSTVDEWLDALQLPPDARMRRNPRFVQALGVFCDNVKFPPHQKREMLANLKFNFAADPKAAGYTDGVLPYEVPGYDESEMEPWLAYGVKGQKPQLPTVPYRKMPKEKTA